MGCCQVRGEVGDGSGIMVRDVVWRRDWVGVK